MPSQKHLKKGKVMIINNKPAGRSELIIVLKAPPTAKAYIPINRKMIKINKQTAMYIKAM